MADTLRMHAFVEQSRANGPGNRAVLWVQSCTLQCPGCFNQATHAPGGEVATVDNLVGRLMRLCHDPDPARRVEGVTITGGEPLQQAQGVLGLIIAVKTLTPLSVVLFSGFNYESEIKRMPMLHRLTLVNYVDVLISGRYEADKRVGHSLTGSSNKEFRFFSSRYKQADFAAVPPAEVIIKPGGEIVATGVNPLKLVA